MVFKKDLFTKDTAYIIDINVLAWQYFFPMDAYGYMFIITTCYFSSVIYYSALLV